MTVSKELSETTDTGTENMLSSLSKKSIVAVNDVGFCKVQDTSTSTLSFAIPSAFPYGNRSSNGMREESGGNLGFGFGSGLEGNG